LPNGPPRFGVGLVFGKAVRSGKNYLVFSVVFSVVMPPAAGAVVFVFVSAEVVVAPVVSSPLVCVVVVWVLFSVVPFLVSQPMVNVPSAAIRTNARKRFILIPFLISGALPFYQQKPFLPEALPPWLRTSLVARNKKTDVAEHPKAFDHVGLLFNKPTGKAGLFFS
jgi:hypothetical protein